MNASSRARSTRLGASPSGRLGPRGADDILPGCAAVATKDARPVDRLCTVLCGLLLPADVIDRPPLDSKRQVIERQVIERQVIERQVIERQVIERQGPLAAAGVRPEHERVVVEPFVERLLEAR